MKVSQPFLLVLAFSQRPQLEVGLWLWVGLGLGLGQVGYVVMME